MAKDFTILFLFFWLPFSIVMGVVWAIFQGNQKREYLRQIKELRANRPKRVGAPYKLEPCQGLPENFDIDQLVGEIQSELKNHRRD